MYNILSNVLTFPERYTMAGRPVAQVEANARRFDLEAFEHGDFYAGVEPVADLVRYETCDIVNSSIRPESVSILVSFAVLEHVDDVDGVYKRIYDSMKPGGTIFHFIDLADHRSYRFSGEYNALSFLTEQEAPKGVNRLRASEHVSAQESAGFQVLHNETVQSEMPDEIRDNLVPKFACMDPEDLRVTKQRLVLKKPR